ncbi:hypothetical protein CY34DRAFT_19148 [Suillus luteus UH-Slu-Lm8-n1]|uniref:Uncharacterized protein n=1 Tax=Suillus luteus UH-Slu-Lm8-n1 TaxID=930992 RepID=A0A0C9ZSM7_9AGAM|nr:hypothetical protein CY34DRAFT_19148 [Suillus luteus UH-Slu-Lm8-n1]
MASSRGRGSRGHSPKCGGHGLVTESSTPQSASPPINAGSADWSKPPTIHWDKKNSPHTACLIEWCKVNQEACLKIFSDSAKDAKEEGRTCQQMTTQKNVYLQQLAATIFENDEDLKVREYFKAHPLAFTKPIQSQFTFYFSLRKKYNEINMQLGQTGAGLSFEAINGNEMIKSMLGLLVAFPWPGLCSRDCESLWDRQREGKEIPPLVDDEDHLDVENDEGGDSGPQNEELEPGQINESEVGGDDDFPMDENNVPPLPHTNNDLDWPEWDENDSSGLSSSPQLPQPQASSSNSSLVPSFQLPASTSHRPIIPLLDMNHNQMMQMDFSSDNSDASMSQMMKCLTVHSRKASDTHHSGHTSSDQDSDPLSTTSNRSASRKRPCDMAAKFNAKLNDASDSLMRHIQDSTTAKIEHKCLKIESKLAGIKLKAHLTRDKCEHVLWHTSIAQSYEQAMADERTRQLELEIKLEQVKLEHLALEKEMSRQGN